MSLNDSTFRDLYIGNGFTEFRGLIGAGEIQAPVPSQFIPEIEIVKSACLEIAANTKLTEFSYRHEKRLYRVTIFNGSGDNRTFIIRQTPTEIFKVDTIGIPPYLREIFRNAKSCGLVLVSGGLGEGKTSTAAAVLADRISNTGGMAVSVEDPIETLLDGRHGKGRCVQIEVLENEGYAGSLKKAMRVGGTDMLIGEIRDGDTAYEALKASNNGMFVIATIHAKSIIDAIERIITLSQDRTPSAREILSTSLLSVMYQRLNIVKNNDGAIIKKVADIQGVHIPNEINGSAICNKIKRGDTTTLESEFTALRLNMINSRG